jgi:peroxiredoxin
VKKAVQYSVFLGILLLAMRGAARATTGAEERVLDYVRTHLQPGQPLMVTDLYNRVFTQPDERQALNKLYNAFFRIPLFVANYQEKHKKPPTLAVIAQQFDLHSAADADVLLRVMESDPRVPQFLTRDPKTGEITHIDVESIKADPNFGQVLARQIGGWEGEPAPDVTLTRLGGSNLSLADFRGKTVLLEVWFTGCPPCMQEAPALVSLDQQLSSKGLVVVGANADQVLGLDYDDSVREGYIREYHINYPIANWNPEADRAYGGISIFPTVFLVDRRGIVRGHWIGYVTPETLQRAVITSLNEK